MAGCEVYIKRFLAIDRHPVDQKRLWHNAWQAQRRWSHSGNSDQSYVMGMVSEHDLDHCSCDKLRLLAIIL